MDRFSLSGLDDDLIPRLIVSAPVVPGTRSREHPSMSRLLSALLFSSGVMLASCQSYDTLEFRFQPISRQELERANFSSLQVPDELAECVYTTGAYLSPLTDPQGGWLEGGYGVSQSSLTSRDERVFQATRLGLDACGVPQSRWRMPSLTYTDDLVCRPSLAAHPCLPWPPQAGAEVRFHGEG